MSVFTENNISKIKIITHLIYSSRSHIFMKIMQKINIIELITTNRYFVSNNKNK